MTVFEAIALVMADVGHVAKTEKNQQQGFSFRGIDAVLNAVGPALRKHGVIVAPHDVQVHREPVTVGRNQTLMQAVNVTVTYRWHGPGGDHLDTIVAAEAMDAGDKATSKAMSVALRTCLLQTLALPTDEPDPDHDVYERSGDLTAKVEELLDELKTAGVDVDEDEVRGYANRGTRQAQAAIRRLTGMRP